MPKAAGRDTGPDIVGIGVACMDHAVAIESLNAGERIERTALHPDRRRHGGHRHGGRGQAGGELAASPAAPSDDPAGQLHPRRTRRRRHRPGVLPVATRPGYTGVSLCMSETCTGRKLIIGLAGGTQRMTPADVDEGFYRMVRRAKLLHLDGFHGEAGDRRGGAARDAGVPVHLDATIGGPGSDRFLAASDIVFASQSFCEGRFSRDVSPKALDWLLDITPARWVGLTMGAAGSIALDRKTNKRYCQPAFDIQVLDTVGAGDSFHGRSSFALARGWPMDKAMRLATAVGAMCCLGLGGREGLPTLRQAQAFLRRAKPLAPAENEEAAMTGRQRIAAAFAAEPTDRVPIFEQTVFSNVASAALGRPLDIGGGELRYREVCAWLQGQAAHAQFVEKMLQDVAWLYREVGYDMVRMPWRETRQSSKRIDEHTFLFGDREDVWRSSPTAPRPATGTR